MDPRWGPVGYERSLADMVKLRASQPAPNRFGMLTPTTERAWNGRTVPGAGGLTKQNTGALGERISLDYLKGTGILDAAPLNTHINNYPVDQFGGRHAYEVKTGLASNSSAAQQWRATIGQPSPTEANWLRNVATPEEKAAHNAQKSQDILDRKAQALRDLTVEKGFPVQGRTISLILNTETKIVDVHEWDGFSLRTGWNIDKARASYKGSFRYE